jgi:tetratricopeptide (TPR) repeat protein
MLTATPPLSGEAAQLLQTVDMFELITANEPLDYQSLEILKEAYAKLGRDAEVVSTSKRIANAYVQLGQLSSAILEYESVLKRLPEDTDAQAALAQLEAQANQFIAPAKPSLTTPPLSSKPTQPTPAQPTPAQAPTNTPLQDGRAAMERLFVQQNHISAADFDRIWTCPDLSANPRHPSEPFIHLAAEKQLLQPELSLRLLTEQTRLAYLPLEKYDVDVDLARSFPRATCLRWCVLPFDRLSKSVMVATANPFNQEAERELLKDRGGRLLWYIANPQELLKMLRKIHR